ncbi:hypothetical protein IEQ34_013318 [Dendrobium chrysotoxum]|uniref:Uncharacterized protein n=1 Tax=Dendrobium chrysotoxum TaxID=161865 RepID=A0AAV7GQP0_DENCH|nr:hypothetical protein IEQ34_013318 [Dendrobium chrysotoxum]
MVGYDLAKSWASAFFYARNDLSLLEKWGKMRDLPAPLQVGEEDIMRLLKVPDVKHLLYEVRYLNKYIKEEFLFKVGLFFHPGRSDVWMLKPTFKIPEPPAPAPKVALKRQAGGEDPQVLLKKNKLDGVAMSTSKVPPVSSPIKFRVLGGVLSHQYVGCHKANNLLSRRTELEAELTEALNEWNAEFVDLERAEATITQLCEDQRASVEKVAVLEAENKRSQTLIAEKETALTGFKSLRVIEDFKKSIAFKIII